MIVFAPFIESIISLRNDSCGQGHFGAPRGTRKHNGVDIIITPGQAIYGPFNGSVQRHTKPYSDNSKYDGAWLRLDDYPHLLVKIFYFKPSILAGAKFKKGDIIGYAQDISQKYTCKGMISHLHIEVFNDSSHNPTFPLSTRINPTSFIPWGQKKNIPTWDWLTPFLGRFGSIRVRTASIINPQRPISDEIED